MQYYPTQTSYQNHCIYHRGGHANVEIIFRWTVKTHPSYQKKVGIPWWWTRLSQKSIYHILCPPLRKPNPSQPKSHNNCDSFINTYWLCMLPIEWDVCFVMDNIMHWLAFSANYLKSKYGFWTAETWYLINSFLAVPKNAVFVISRD